MSPTLIKAIQQASGGFDRSEAEAFLNNLAQAGYKLAKIPTPKAVGIQPGEAFFDAFVQAKRNATESLPGRWHLVEGASQWITIPAALASFKTERGTRIKIHRDMRAPAPRFWPNGVMPAGVVMVPEGPRHTGPLTPSRPGAGYYIPEAEAA